MIGTEPSTKPDGSAMVAGVGCSSLLAAAAGSVDTFGRAPEDMKAARSRLEVGIRALGVLKTLRACSATVPVQSCRELLPKYGVMVSSASPFSNFRRYRVRLHSSMNH